MNTMMDNQYLLYRYHREFDNIFHADMGDFMDLMRGFYVTDFKKYVECPTNKNLNKFLEDKYGEDAVRLIEEISKGSFPYKQ